MEEVDSGPESDPEAQEAPDVQPRVFPIIDRTKGLRKMMNDRNKVYDKIINFSGRAEIGASFLAGKDGPVFIPRKYLSKQHPTDTPRMLEVKKQEAMSKMRKDNNILSDKAKKQKMTLSKLDKNIDKKITSAPPSDRDALKEEVKVFNKWKEEKAHKTWAKKEAWQRKQQSEAGDEPRYLKEPPKPPAIGHFDATNPKPDPELSSSATSENSDTPAPPAPLAPLDQLITADIHSSEGYTYGPESVKSEPITSLPSSTNTFAEVCAAVERIKGLKFALNARHTEYEKYLLNTSLAAQYDTLLIEGNVPDKYIIKEAPGDSERLKEVKKTMAEQKMQKDITEMKRQAQGDRDKLRPLDMQIDQKIQKANPSEQEKLREDVKEWKRHKQELARKYVEYQCKEAAEGRDCKRPRIG